MHRTPDGIIQNWLDECHRNESNIDLEAEFDLVVSKIGYYKTVTKLAAEQVVTERLKQRLLELQIEEMEDFGSKKEFIKYKA